jgi:hypothetical protein
MLSFLKKYYPEILVFGFIATILFTCLSPDYTFVNKGADSIGYAYSAKYLYPSFHTSPPLYLVVSHFFLMLPFGTEAWRMGLVSTLSTLGACVFIYLIIRKQLADKKYFRWLALLGVLVYGTSAIVISQSVIIQTYPLTCMLSIGAYYFAVKQQWKRTALMLGLGMIVHLLAFFIALIIILAFKGFRKNWKCWLIMGVMMIAYIYIPLTNRPPYMWQPDPSIVNSNLPPFLVNIYSFVVDTASTVGYLIGKLSIYDTPKRIFDIIGIVGVSVGVVAIIPIVYYFFKTKYYTNVLFWLALTPSFIFLVNMDENTYDYCMLSIPFLSVITALGMSKLIENKGRLAIKFACATAVVLIGFGSFNMWYFDVGHHSDPNMTAKNLYYVEFAKIPDYAIFMPNYCSEWEAIYKYNRDFNKHIYPISIDILPSHQYLQTLKADGIKFVEGTNENVSLASRETAASIIELNDNVWTTISTEPETFGVTVIKATDPKVVDIYDVQKMKDIAEHPTVKWMPSNPYRIIDSSLCIQEWGYVLMSNNNISRLILYSTLGFAVVYIVRKQFKKNKK